MWAAPHRTAQVAGSPSARTGTPTVTATAHHMAGSHRCGMAWDTCESRMAVGARSSACKGALHGPMTQRLQWQRRQRRPRPHRHARRHEPRPLLGHGDGRRAGSPAALPPSPPPAPHRQQQGRCGQQARLLQPLRSRRYLSLWQLPMASSEKAQRRHRRRHRRRCQSGVVPAPLLPPSPGRRPLQIHRQRGETAGRRQGPAATPWRWPPPQRQLHRRRRRRQ